MEYKAWLVKGGMGRAKQIRGKSLNSFCSEQAQRLALKGDHRSGMKDASMQKKMMSGIHHDTKGHDAAMPQCQSIEHGRPC